MLDDIDVAGLWIILLLPGGCLLLFLSCILGCLLLKEFGFDFLNIFGFSNIGAIGIRGFGMTEVSSFGDYLLYVPTVGTGFGFMSHLDMLLEHALTVGHLRTCLRVVMDVWVHAGLHLGFLYSYPQYCFHSGFG